MVFAARADRRASPSIIGFVALPACSRDLARHRLVLSPPGAAVRARRAVQGAGPLVLADQGALVGVVRCSCVVGYLLVTIIGSDHPVGLAGHRRASSRDDNAIANAIATVVGSTLSSAITVPVPGRGADDPLLRPARAQGGLRPPAARRGHGRRARPGRAAARAADRRRPVHARAARRRAVLAAAAGLGAAAGASREPVAVGVLRAGWSAPSAAASDRRCAGRATPADPLRRRPRRAADDPSRPAAPTDGPPPTPARRAPRGRRADGLAAAGPRTAARRGRLSPPCRARTRRPPRPPADEPTTTRAQAGPRRARTGCRPRRRAGREGCEPRPRRGRRAPARGRGVVLAPAAARATAVTRARSSGRSRARRPTIAPALAELRAGRLGRRAPVDVAARCAAPAATRSTRGCGARGSRYEDGPAARDPRADARDVLAERRFHETERAGAVHGADRAGSATAASLGPRTGSTTCCPAGARSSGSCSARCSPGVAWLRRAAAPDAPHPRRRRRPSSRGRRSARRGPEGARPPRRRRRGRRRPRGRAAAALPRRPAAPRRARRDRLPPLDLHPRGPPRAALGGLRRARRDVRRRRLRRPPARRPRTSPPPASAGPRSSRSARKARVKLPRDPRACGSRSGSSRCAASVRRRAALVVDRLAPTPKGPPSSSYATSPAGLAAYAVGARSAPGIRCGGCARASPSSAAARRRDAGRPRPRRDGARGGAGDRRLGPRRRAARRRRRRRRVLARRGARRAARSGSRRRRRAAAHARPRGRDRRRDRGASARRRRLARARRRAAGDRPAPTRRCSSPPRSGEGSVALLADASPLQNRGLGARRRRGARARAGGRRRARRSRSWRPCTATASRAASAACPRA